MDTIDDIKANLRVLFIAIGEATGTHARLIDVLVRGDLVRDEDEAEALIADLQAWSEA